MPRVTNKAKADRLFTRADKEEDCGRMRSAFRLMLAAAKLGDIGAQLNVGNYYDDARGVRRNRAAALYWYNRAYRRGYSCAAHNIGILWRNEGNLKRALQWFQRAVELGDDESNLDIGKHFLKNKHNPRKAVMFFKRVIGSNRVSEAGMEEAIVLLLQAENQLRA